MPRLQQSHYLKCWPSHFQAIIDGIKTFDVRLNDRDFVVHDFLVLQEYEPTSKRYTKRDYCVRIEFILTGEQWGLRTGYCVLGLAHKGAYQE